MPQKNVQYYVSVRNVGFLFGLPCVRRRCHTSLFSLPCLGTQRHSRHRQSPCQQPHRDYGPALWPVRSWDGRQCSFSQSEGLRKLLLREEGYLLFESLFFALLGILLHLVLKSLHALPALCRERMADNILAGGGDANTPPATAADSMPAPT